MTYNDIQSTVKQTTFTHLFLTMKELVFNRIIHIGEVDPAEDLLASFCGILQ